MLLVDNYEEVQSIIYRSGMVIFGAKSDKGIQREINEDNYNILSGYKSVPLSFIIADGMGGHNSGEIASKLAVENISNDLLRFNELLNEKGSVDDVIVKIMKLSNSKVFSESNLENINFIR